MSAVGEMIDRKDRPAYVRFERRAIEDKLASQREGRYVSKDVDFALVTPPYSRDVFEQVAGDWLKQMEQEVRNRRLPQEWYERYVQTYERWKKGEEMPLDGTPVKGWGMISPAQQKNLIALNILTVEDLAGVNDEGCRRIGMGASELRDKAKAWLSQTKDKGPLTMENAALKAENRALKTQVESLEGKVASLTERVEALLRGGLDPQYHFEPRVAARDEGITAADIIEPAEQKRPPKRGKQDAAPI